MSAATPEAFAEGLPLFLGTATIGDCFVHATAPSAADGCVKVWQCDQEVVFQVHDALLSGVVRGRLTAEGWLPPCARWGPMWTRAFAWSNGGHDRTAEMITGFMRDVLGIAGLSVMPPPFNLITDVRFAFPGTPGQRAALAELSEARDEAEMFANINWEQGLGREYPDADRLHHFEAPPPPRTGEAFGLHTRWGSHTHDTLLHIRDPRDPHVLFLSRNPQTDAIRTAARPMDPHGHTTWLRQGTAPYYAHLLAAPNLRWQVRRVLHAAVQRGEPVRAAHVYTQGGWFAQVVPVDMEGFDASGINFGVGHLPLHTAPPIG